MPAYVHAFHTGALQRTAASLKEQLRMCDLCPRRCGVDRLSGRLGFCRTDARLKVAAVSVHPWEEPPIAGTRGSGTIFFSGCTLQCLFCQNYPISQMGVGRVMDAETLAEKMLGLQRRGVHNINLVTPTHQVPQFLEALVIATQKGLSIPLVYNSSGYERVALLRALDGIVDIYLPDIKFASQKAAAWCCGRADYVVQNRRALLAMWRQVGPLQCDEDGVAVRGLLVRHLVLPEDLSGTSQCLGFLRRALGKGVWVSLMDQYFPAHKALKKPPLDRKPTTEEIHRAFKTAWKLGLRLGFTQETCPCGA
ncbi:radical SAM protein [Desulfosoma caldarium]|uniref:Putative pyruvate formate lyase activating enzyme n=1 Tax=Desulfosoma caldarium TaxID=610254 RepID=A0A3N1VU18_9BACT|nr:radical SAM protein [Desulfosoma caldarium]ROR03267.1 putative pyruvate formate lyase activating enzyme [Desulfosoma caldarium]